MAYEKEHCEDCIIELGEPFTEVHKWLDEFFATKGPAHRDIRHHEDGVEEVRKKWGGWAAKAAEIHIRRDCGGKVPTMEDIRLQKLFSQ